MSITPPPVIQETKRLNSTPPFRASITAETIIAAPGRRNADARAVFLTSRDKYVPDDLNNLEGENQ